MFHELLVNEARDSGLDVAVQFALRLALELRLGQLDADHAHQAFAHVLTLKVFLHVLEQALVLAELIDGAGERGAEAGQVRAAVHCIDVVGERKDGFRVPVVVLDGELHLDLVALGLGIDRRRVEHVLVLVQVLDEFGDAARVMEFRLLVTPLVLQPDGQAFIQKRQLAQALGESVVIEFNGVENLGVRHESNFRATPLGLAFALEWIQWLPALVGLFPGVAVAPDLEVEPLRERVDH